MALQRPRYGNPHQVVDFPLPGKAHLVLGGMNVHVHRVGRNLQMDHRHREAPFDQALPVALEQGVLHHPVAHDAAVDKDKDAPGGAAKHPGGGNPAGDTAGLGSPLQRMELAMHALTQDIQHPLQRVGGGGPILETSAVVVQPERDGRPP
jgi:hypothetical protein